MLSRKELEDIIARDLPDHELVSVDLPDPDRGGSADAQGEDIVALRERFLGRTDAAGTPKTATARNEHDMIVAVRSKKQAARPKTVIVSGRDKRVIGSQG
jgi:hypothetical protein